MKTKKGFALPTVMIASVVMLSVLLAGLVYASSTNVTVRDQYYDQLAREAAESGINLLIGCIRTGITPSGTFTPQSTSCTNNAADNSKSAFVLDTTSAGTRIKTSFTATTTGIDAAGYYDINATGSVQLFRTSSTTTAWRTVSKPLNLHIRAQSYFPSNTATGNGFVCALLNNQNWCWGTNVNAEHGDGNADANTNPTQTKRNETATVTYGGTTYSRSMKAGEIDTTGGDNFACAISTDNVPAYGTPQSDTSTNMVYCWGSQDSGRLGNGVNSTTILATPTVVNPVWLASTQYPVQVISGTTYACTRTTQSGSNGNVWCWGVNSSGQMGRGNNTSPQLTPVRAGTGLGIVAKYIMGSNATMCAIDNSDQAWCWGNNQWGQTGSNNGSGNNQTSPVKVVTGASNLTLYVSAISMAMRTGDAYAPSGGGHGCAISQGSSGDVGDYAGRIYCWGSRDHGEAGVSINASPFTKATAIPTIDGSSTYYADSISASWRATCALVRLGGSGAPTSTRRIYCWGNNVNGELGVNRPPSITTGANYSTTNTNLNNRTPLEQTADPQRIYIDPDVNSRDHFSEADVREITEGGTSFRFCVIAGSHNYCWGRNEKGQTGDGTTAGDYTTDPLATTKARFYPRLSVFAESKQTGITY